MQGNPKKRLDLEIKAVGKGIGQNAWVVASRDATCFAVLRDQRVECIRASIEPATHLLNGEIVFRAPKTAEGRRMIALTPSTALVPREHWERQEAMRILLGKPLTDDDLIFS